MLPVVVARSSSDDNAMCYVLPVLWMTSRLSIMGYMARGSEGVVKVTHQRAATGRSHDVYDCFVITFNNI